MLNSSKIFNRVIIAIVFLGLFYACKNDDPSPENKFPASKVSSIFIDGQGVVWAGTDIGIISYWNNEWTSFESLNTGAVVDIAAGSGNQLWLATAKGAQLADFKLNEITSAKLHTTSTSGLIDNRISALLTDAVEANWFATPKGISLLIKEKWYSEDGFGDLELYPVISMATKSDGWIFAGTSGQGVDRYKYDSGIDAISGASNYTAAWTGLPSDTILCIYVDKDNRQWFGTPRGLAFHAVWETKKEWKKYFVSDGLISNRVQAITADAAGKIWVGTDLGVSSFDGQIWKNYTVTDGLLNSSVNDIAIDSKGAVWFATNGGISVLEGTKWKSFSK